MSSASHPDSTVRTTEAALARLEKDNAALRAELARVSLERTEYLQNVSHQLVAPLNAIKWHIENITNNRVGVERAKKVLRSIYSQAALRTPAPPPSSVRRRGRGDASGPGCPRAWPRTRRRTAASCRALARDGLVVDSRAAPGRERGDRPRGIHVEDGSASGEGVMSARTDPPQDRALRRRPRPRSSVARHARERSTVDDVRLDGGGRHVLPAHLAPSADQKSGRATG